MSRIGYLRIPSRNSTAIVAAALDLPPKGTGGNCRIAFAFCSPKDTFVKSIGRDLAQNRLNTWRPTKGCRIELQLRSDDKINVPHLIVKALKKAYVENRLPGWMNRIMKNSDCVIVGTKNVIKLKNGSRVSPTRIQINFEEP